MKALVVYESMYGNTAEVAQAVAAGMEQAGAEVTLTAAAKASREAADDFDVVVIGAPTHAFTLSTVGSRRNAARDGAAVDPADQGVREWLTSLRSLRAPVIAVFDTRMWSMRHWPVSAARKIARLLRRVGARPATPPVGFCVRGAKGPLVDGEVDRARSWGAQLVGEVRQAA